MPVSMSVSGDVLVVAVAPFVGRYRLPIAVDPEIWDDQLGTSKTGETTFHSGWYFQHGGEHAGEGGAFTAPEPQGASGLWSETIAGTHSASEFGGLFYTTRGESQIVQASVEGSWNDENARVQNFLLLDVPEQVVGSKKEPAHIESLSDLPVKTEGREVGGTVCAPERHCSGTTAEGAAGDGNTAAYEQESTQAVSGGSGWTNTLTSAHVEICSGKGARSSFQHHEPDAVQLGDERIAAECTLRERRLVGTAPRGVRSRRERPGARAQRISAAGWRAFDDRPLDAEGACDGVQCPEKVDQGYVYDSPEFDLHEGEDSLEAFAEDPLGLSDQVYPQKVKVDATPPHRLSVVGLQNGDELPLGEAYLKIEASDGEGSPPSSGIQIDHRDRRRPARQR